MSTTLGFLVGQAGEFSGLRIAIPETGLIIGRDPSQADVVFRHPMVSRRHAQIAPDKKGTLYLIDLGSQNGIHVNGRKITGAVPLNAGDKVDFGGSGKVVFIFETADTPSVTGILNQIFGEIAASVDWKVGDTILDIYEVTGILGQGGMGKVYKVHHKSWNTDLAVKSPLPHLFAKEEAVENFVREAETWVNLNLHPNIVQCFYVRAIGGIPRIFAEFVPGGSLHEWIEKRKLTQLDRILDVAIQFAWGLHAAHEQGLVHQDVKPLNVLMTPEGVAKVSDFGLARSRPPTGGHVETGPNNLVTMAGLFTQAYCSPEQVQGKRLSRKTDIWSFGVSLLHVFAGQVTWKHGLQAAKILEEYQRLFGPKFAVKMPKQLAKLLARCFKFNPDDRPKDMLEVAAELQEIYRKTCGRTYPRPEPTPALHLADSLNNRALSLLDLKKPEEALQVFDQALAVEPSHPECLYNRGLLLWRQCKLTDQALVTALREATTHPSKAVRGSYLMGLVHLERGDSEGAVKVLETACAEGKPSLEAKAVLEKAKALARTSTSVRTFEGHTEGVTSVALSADGRWALSGSYDKILRIWDVATGRCVRIFEGHTDEVMSVAMTADGRWALSSGNEDETLRLWDVASGRCVRTFEGHTGGLTPVALMADGRWALSGGDDLRLWDVASGRCVRTFEGHFEGHSLTVNSVALTADGRWALSGSEDHTLRLWDVASGRCVRIFEGHTDEVMSVAMTAEGRWALSGSSDSTVRLWELASGRCVRTFEGHTEGVTSVALSADGRWALSGSWDKTLRIWEVTNGQHSRWVVVRPITSIEQLQQGIRFRDSLQRGLEYLDLQEWKQAVTTVREALNCNGYGQASEALDLLARANVRGTRVKLLSGFCRKVLTGCTFGTLSAVQTADGCWALSGSEDHALRLWEVASGRCVRMFEGHTSWVTSVSLSADGRWALSGSYDKTLRLWEVATSRCVRTFENADWVTSVNLSADGRWALLGSSDKTLRLWEAATGRCVRTFENADWVTSVSLSADGRWALSGSRDKTLRLWELVSGRCMRIFEGHTTAVNSVALTADGRWALSGGEDHTLRLWELASGRCVRTFEGHTAGVLSVALTADGRWALSGSRDKTLRLWEVATGRCVRTFEGHAEGVTSVALTADGRWASSGSWDSTLRLWELQWECEFPDTTDWDEAARPYLQTFLTFHCPYGSDGFSRTGQPSWLDDDFQKLLFELQHHGYGWLRPEGVRRQLEKMAANWNAPP